MNPFQGARQTRKTGLGNTVCFQKGITTLAFIKMFTVTSTNSMNVLGVEQTARKLFLPNCFSLIIEARRLSREGPKYVLC